jgi:hypothetical protein
MTYIGVVRLVVVALLALAAAASARQRAPEPLLLPCITHYVLPGRAGDRVYVELDRPASGRCELDIREQLARARP